MKKSKTKSKAKHTNGSATSREKAYLKTLDLREWWEEFAFKTHKNGTQSYPTVWSFIKKKAKQSWQRDFLYWLLGPKATEGKSPYSEFPQHDFATRRENGFWYTSKNIENLKSEIKRKDTSFARLQTAGESLLSDLGEMQELNSQLSREFGGRLFLPDNTAEENASRAALFFELKAKVQNMKAGILQTFAKTQGMDLNQLSNFLELFAGGMGAAASQQLGYGGLKQLEDGGKDNAGYTSVMRALADMTMRKAADLDMELPDDGKTLVSEIVHEGRPNGKAKLQ